MKPIILALVTAGVLTYAYTALAEYGADPQTGHGNEPSHAHGIGTTTGEGPGRGDTAPGQNGGGRDNNHGNHGDRNDPPGQGGGGDPSEGRK